LPRFQERKFLFETFERGNRLDVARVGDRDDAATIGGILDVRERCERRAHCRFELAQDGIEEHDVGPLGHGFRNRLVHVDEIDRKGEEVRVDDKR